MSGIHEAYLHYQRLQYTPPQPYVSEASTLVPNPTLRIWLVNRSDILAHTPRRCELASMSTRTGVNSEKSWEREVGREGMRGEEKLEEKEKVEEESGDVEGLRMRRMS